MAALVVALLSPAFVQMGAEQLCASGRLVTSAEACAEARSALYPESAAFQLLELESGPQGCVYDNQQSRVGFVAINEEVAQAASEPEGYG